MKYGMVINLDRCSGCDSCVAACKYENGLGLGTYRTRVSTVSKGVWPDVEAYYLPVMCQQCANPGCIEVCPTGASYRDEETGVVTVNQADCIGCGSCLMGCPFKVRWLDPATNVIEKCTLCLQRKDDEEWLPMCASICPGGALFFGDLDDPESAASKALAAGANYQLPDDNGLTPTNVYVLNHTAWEGVLEGQTRLTY